MFVMGTSLLIYWSDRDRDSKDDRDDRDRRENGGSGDDRKGSCDTSSK